MAMKPSGFKPVRGKSVTIKLQPPKPAKPKVGLAPPVTPGKLARSPEKDDVLITTRKSPDIIRTTVRERMTPAKKTNTTIKTPGFRKKPNVKRPPDFEI